MEWILHLITGIGIPAVIAVIFAESGLLIGFFLPGDSLLFTSGFLVTQGIFNINIHLFVLLLWIAAVLGDSTGYAFGHKVGRKIFERKNSKFFKVEYLHQAEKFYEKHGGKAIILARFVPIVRTFAPIVAGMSKMHYNKFLAYNIVGGLGWTAGFTYLGYFLGKKLIDAGVNIEVMAILIILLSISPMIWHALSDKKTRDRLFAATKNQLNVVFRRKR